MLILREMSSGETVLQNGITTTFTMSEFNLLHNRKWDGSFLWLNLYYDHVFQFIVEHNY